MLFLGRFYVNNKLLHFGKQYEIDQAYCLILGNLNDRFILRIEASNMLRMLKLLQEFGRDVSLGIINIVESRECNRNFYNFLTFPSYVGWGGIFKVSSFIHMKRVEKAREATWLAWIENRCIRQLGESSRSIICKSMSYICYFSRRIKIIYTSLYCKIKHILNCMLFPHDSFKHSYQN